MSVLQLCRHCGNQIQTAFNHTPSFECGDCQSQLQLLEKLWAKFSEDEKGEKS